jgi:5-oxoprolinase (ATP-hydrolysing) subunit A
MGDTRTESAISVSSAQAVSAITIDLNADLGESFGSWNLGRDEEMMALISSTNIACGFHAGDPLVIRRTIDLAMLNGVTMGAHPGYPDLVGFGRRRLEMAVEELEAAVEYQVAALSGMARAAGGELRHVKPHGALYQVAADDPAVAEAVIRAVSRISRDLMVVGPAGSALVLAGRAAGLAVRSEAFADRAYEPDGRLRSRRLPGAVHDDTSIVVQQALAIAMGQPVVAYDGSSLAISADTLCLHGDTPIAVELARAIRGAFQDRGIQVTARPRPRG